MSNVLGGGKNARSVLHSRLVGFTTTKASLHSAWINIFKSSFAQTNKILPSYSLLMVVPKKMMQLLTDLSSNVINMINVLTTFLYCNRMNSWSNTKINL